MGRNSLVGCHGARPPADRVPGRKAFRRAGPRRPNKRGPIPASVLPGASSRGSRRETSSAPWTNTEPSRSPAHAATSPSRSLARNHWLRRPRDFPVPSRNSAGSWTGTSSRVWCSRSRSRPGSGRSSRYSTIRLVAPRNRVAIRERVRPDGRHHPAELVGPGAVRPQS
jgi:hypothetical protein